MVQPRKVESAGQRNLVRNFLAITLSALEHNSYTWEQSPCHKPRGDDDSLYMQDASVYLAEATPDSDQGQKTLSFLKLRVYTIMAKA